MDIFVPLSNLGNLISLCSLCLYFGSDTWPHQGSRRDSWRGISGRWPHRSGRCSCGPWSWMCALGLHSALAPKTAWDTSYDEFTPLADLYSSWRFRRYLSRSLRWDVFRSSVTVEP